MKTLKADNRALLDDAQMTYLITNYASGASSVDVLDGTLFSSNDYVLIGDFGDNNAEILKVNSVSTNTLTFKNESGTSINTSKSHFESSTVAKIRYNQLKFYHADTEDFSAATLLATKDITETFYYTQYDDAANSSGYGWYKFYNSTTGNLSQESSSIPYAGYTRNKVNELYENFFSLLNNREQKLVTNDDFFRWANEGYIKLKENLNIVNLDYSLSDKQALSIVSGTAEYALQSDIDDLISVVDSYGNQLTKISAKDIDYYANNSVSEMTYFYLRGNNIGFVSTPTSDTTIYYRYTSLGSKLDSMEDAIDLPGGAYNNLLNWLLFRAYQKLTNPQASSMYYELFDKDVQSMKINSIKRDQEDDSWTVESSSNV